ncbi:hypothetical protein QYF36_004410 [Acer negundo]|nr:hypothetical protein QYF36_004410 [Acer negundo]
MDGNMDAKVSSDRKSQTSDAKRGGWITFPFIAGTITGLGLAGGGWSSNLIVYLIEKFNIKSMDAAQIFSVVNGCMNLFPVIGAIVADSFLGCFSVVFISSLFSLLVCEASENQVTAVELSERPEVASQATSTESGRRVATSMKFGRRARVDNGEVSVGGGLVEDGN